MPNDVVEGSVQKKPIAERKQSVFLFSGDFDESIPKWWSPRRDAFFRDFWPKEPVLASAIYSIASRNAAFGWELDGLPEDVKWAQTLLQSADFGGGWQQLITKTTVDLATCDNGAFWEVIRPAKVRVDGLVLRAVKQRFENNEEPEWFALRKVNGVTKKVRLRGKDYKLFDSPMDRPIGLAHLDSGRVERTGDPSTPAIYQDIHGKYHPMRPWQIAMFSDMASPVEDMNGVGVCALSRMFRMAHILQSLSVYKDEKISGRFARSIYITNADPDLINDQVAQASAQASNVGLQRYSQPVIASTFDPSAVPTVERIDLANLPDGFSENDTMEWYITILSLALGVDYGFLAPLPGKGLGTASQSETMARQARGKSSRLFMDMTSNVLNFRGILPESVQFRYIERDTQREMEEETVKKTRAETRQIMIASGEITPQISRQIAADNGDLKTKYLDVMGESDITPGVDIPGDENLQAQQVVRDTQPPSDITQQIQASQAQATTPKSLDKGQSVGPKKVKAYQREIFTKTQTLAHQAQNVARAIVGKKQQEESVDDAINVYRDDLEELALGANDGDLPQETFEELFGELVYTSLLAFYAQFAGRNYDGVDTLDITIEHNLEAVDRLSNDIYSGRYYDNEDGLQRRLDLWLSDARLAADVGRVSNPDNAGQRYMFVLGPTSDHCADCMRLDRQIHTAEEWLNHPQYLPRSRSLACHGFHCLCELEPTNEPVRGDF
jgi:hypothetical protein